MKQKAFLFIILFSALSATAQLRWGVEAGANVSHAFDTNRTKTGFNIGATAEYSFSEHWYVDGALKLSSQPCGNKYKTEFSNPGATSSGQEKSSEYIPYYLTLPVRVGYALGLSDQMKLSVSVGPMIGCGLFGKGKVVTKHSETEYMTEEGHSIFKEGNAECFSSSRFEYGLNARLGFEYKSHYTVGIEFNAMHIAGDFAIADNLSIFSFNLGYRF